MSVVKFRIIFDESKKVYYSGGIVTGRVNLVLNSDMKIRGVELKIVGTARCQWHELTTNIFNEMDIAHRRSSETMINNKQILIGGRGKFILPAGEYTYPFGIVLPNTAHTSFKGSYGEISYYAEAKIVIPFGFDIKKKSEFTVIRPMNLDLLPHLRKPYADEETKTFCCLWCTSGPLSVVVRLPKTGFAATESIPLKLDVDNSSNSTILVYIYLKREICWIASGRRKRKDEVLRSIRLGVAEKNEWNRWKGNFEIPSISFPNLDGCTIIRMNHELHIKGISNTWGSSLDMRVPVTIVDILVHNNSETSTVTAQMQFSPDNMADDAEIKMPATEEPPPYSNHVLPEGNHMYPENSNSAPFKEPASQICPSAAPSHATPRLEMNNAPLNPSFVSSSPHLNAAEIPQMLAQENAISVQQYPPQAPPVLASPPSQLALNPECSQNSAFYPVVNNGLEFPSFNSDIQLEKTSFLSDYTKQAANYSTFTTPLQPPDRKY